MHTLSVRDLRIFVAVPRTASTLFMRVMAQNPAVGVTSRNILMGNMVPRPADPAARRPFRPDYSIFEPGHPIYEIAAKMGKRIIVSKEEFGNDRFTGNEALNECNFPMFPNAAMVPRALFVKTGPVLSIIGNERLVRCESSSLL